MADESVGTPPQTPWHLWVVGILAVLWNAVGAFDYLMTQTGNEAYMSQFSPDQLEYFYTFPTWLVFFWATAVWGSVVASVLLLLRREWAVGVFLVSFVAMVVTSVDNFLLRDGLEVMGTGGAVFSVIIFFAALGLWLYSRAMAQRGVLT
jgi:hypothetical protein